MAKKGKGRDGRRPPQRRPVRDAPPGRSRTDEAEAQDLFQDLRSALRSEDPLVLLAMVSSLLVVTDPRPLDVLAPEPEKTPRLDELVESFIGTPYAETTAVLTAIAALVPDEVMAARIGRELAQRQHPLPAWLRGLKQATIESDVWFLTHVLGDGDDYLLGVTLSAGHSLSALVYVDHNLGTVVKDAFVIPEPLAHLTAELASQFIDDDQSLSLVDPATARAVVEEAIDLGSRTYPPLKSDTWPMCRPLIEWMLRKLPAGGVVPDRAEWSERQIAALADDFFASPFATGLDDRDRRGLLESVLWFGTGYGTTDPLRWSSVTVEMLLLDFVPRKVMAEPSYLARLPELLRAFVRYAHDRSGIRDSLTAAALTAIDGHEPEYQQLIRSGRSQGPAGLIASILGAAGDDGVDDTFDPLGGLVLEHLAATVGGSDRLQALDDKPLPDEPFGWVGVPDDTRPIVEQVLERCDRCADELLDAEHRTAMRRFLGRAAVADPALFRRKASPGRGAAAIAWVICRANGTAGGRTGLSVGDLLAHFEVKGSVSQRAEPLLKANGVDPYGFSYSPHLGTPDLLVSAARAELIERRDRWLAEDWDD
ncbi:MAG: hypothetical protein L0H24_00635 [Microlunatus sp.]|nr:hypothetical protein [Microlunatus sp.]